MAPMRGPGYDGGLVFGDGDAAVGPRDGGWMEVDDDGEQGVGLPIHVPRHICSHTQADDNPTFFDSSTTSPTSHCPHRTTASISGEMSEIQEEMKIDPSRAQALISQLGVVKERIANVANGRNVRVNPPQGYLTSTP